MEFPFVPDDDNFATVGEGDLFDGAFGDFVGGADGGLC